MLNMDTRKQGASSSFGLLNIHPDFHMMLYNVEFYRRPEIKSPVDSNTFLWNIQGKQKVRKELHREINCCITLKLSALFYSVHLSNNNNNNNDDDMNVGSGSTQKNIFGLARSSLIVVRQISTVYCQNRASQPNSTSPTCSQRVVLIQIQVNCCTLAAFFLAPPPQGLLRERERERFLLAVSALSFSEPK